MTEMHPERGIIRREAVRMAPQATQIDCGASTGPGKASHPIAVVPLLQGDLVVGFEIRCGCGASAVVECVYQTES
ncbi:MAG: hypothetical protein K8J09_15485 [Planctomycetes bacterium]|nr:hypothetical protein [Planctomycetota bacterium]MCC7396774.1 hypothetical protein [Planctomycetota bacterium]